MNPEDYIGKRIAVDIDDRDERGRKNGKRCMVVGTCDFIGSGLYDLQVSVSRMPVKVESLDDILILTTSSLGPHCAFPTLRSWKEYAGIV